MPRLLIMGLLCAALLSGCFSPLFHVATDDDGNRLYYEPPASLTLKDDNGKRVAERDLLESGEPDWKPDAERLEREAW